MIETFGNIKMQQYFVDTLYSPFDSCKDNDVNLRFLSESI